MIRVVKTEQAVVIDHRQRMPGRGAYVHPRAACVSRALLPGGLTRALRASVPASLRDALRKRIEEVKGS